MGKSIFNKEQIEFIKNNYSTMDTLDIANKLGFTRAQIKGKADTLKLTKGIEVTSFSESEMRFMCENYANMETSLIAKSIGKTVKQVNDKACNMGLKKENMTSYSIDETFFEKINTEEKAYWLGFLYADGSIVERLNRNKTRIKSLTLEVGLSDCDRTHLEKFKIAIGFGGNIKSKYTTINDRRIKTARLVVYNTKMCRDLISLGCTPRKSLTLKFPSRDIVPDEYIDDFIRGYFDGDGCVFHNHNNLSYVINFVGTREFIEGMFEIVSKKININKTKVVKKGNAYQVAWSGYSNFVNWGSYLYEKSNVFLDRKKEGFIHAVETKSYKNTNNIAYYHRNMMA